MNFITLFATSSLSFFKHGGLLTFLAFSCVSEGVGILFFFVFPSVKTRYRNPLIALIEKDVPGEYFISLDVTKAAFFRQFSAFYSSGLAVLFCCNVTHPACCPLHPCCRRLFWSDPDIHLSMGLPFASI